MAEIERELVKKSFSSHARQYDGLAQVQKRVTDRFVELFGNSMSSPAALLDIGAGTGRLVETLQLMLPQTELTGIDLAFGMTKHARNRLEKNLRVSFVCSDAENLPFRSSCFDIVVSTSTYQWITPLEDAFAEVYRVLKPGSRFCFALFGEKTLYELRESYRNAAINSCRYSADRTHEFAASDEVISALTGSGFTGCKVHEEMETEIHADVPDLLRSLKGIGAGSAVRSNGRGLSGRSEMLEMMDIYRKSYGKNGGIQATYHVLYGAGEKR
jgi:malonyl-CoA O-methyltransferase